MLGITQPANQVQSIDDGSLIGVVPEDKMKPFDFFYYTLWNSEDN